MKYFFLGSSSRYNIYINWNCIWTCVKYSYHHSNSINTLQNILFFYHPNFNLFVIYLDFFGEIRTHYDDINAHISRKYGCLQSICMRLWLQPIIKYSFFLSGFFTRFCSRTHKIRSKSKYIENYKSGKFHTYDNSNLAFHFDSFTLACALVFPLVTHRDICVKKFSMLSIFVGFVRERSTFVQTSLIHADTTNGINMRR